MAQYRFQQLKRKLKRNLELRKEYTKFMDEYLSLGHMQLVPGDMTIHQANLYASYRIMLFLRKAARQQKLESF